MDLLEDCLVDELGRTYTRLIGHISFTDLIDVIELLVEYLLHLVRIILILMHLENSVCQTDCVLETRGCQALITTHKWLNFVKVAVEEARDDTVLVIVNLILVEVTVLADQILKVLTTAEVRVD